MQSSNGKQSTVERKLSIKLIKKKVHFHYTLSLFITSRSCAFNCALSFMIELSKVSSFVYFLYNFITTNVFTICYRQEYSNTHLFPHTQWQHPKLMPPPRWAELFANFTHTVYILAAGTFSPFSNLTTLFAFLRVLPFARSLILVHCLRLVGAS